MAIILQTNTVLNIVDGDFTLVTTYSGGTNPNVTYTYTLTVTDTNSNIIEGAIVTINSIEYITDSNGQISVDLERGNYVATVVKTGYVGDSDTFTILDANVSNLVQLSIIGSFDESFDDSFE